eukprot:scaffold275642_cov33-Tisochrysis_lutea.AAC.2
MRGRTRRRTEGNYTRASGGGCKTQNAVMVMGLSSSLILEGKSRSKTYRYTGSSAGKTYTLR